MHDSAQRRLIDELKLVCRERYLQVICTTHSPTILNQLPPEGRFFIERQGEKTVILPGISPLYAAGRLSERNSNELDIFVEDGIAEQIVQAVLPTTLRRRINIVAIGSAAAVVRQMAARFKGRGTCDCIGILDGDQKEEKNKHVNSFLRTLETDKDKDERTQWLEQRIGFLPGNSRPEQWLLTQLTRTRLESLAAQFRLDEPELQTICESALEAGKHREFISLAAALCLPVTEVSAVVCRWVADKVPDQFDSMRALIAPYLD